MRATRVLIVALALALIGLIPAAGSASAKPTTAERTTVVAKQAKAPKVGLKIVKKKGKLYMVGMVTPAKGPLTVQRATKCNYKTGTCTFKYFKKIGVKGNGRYETQVPAPKNGSWAWRARVGSGVSDIWVTCKRKPGQTACPRV